MTEELREDRAIDNNDNMLTEYDAPVGTYTIENYNFFIDLFRKYYVKILNSYEGMRGKKLEFYYYGKHTFDKNILSSDFQIINDVEDLFFYTHTPLTNLHTKIRKYFNDTYGKNIDLSNDAFQEQFIKEGGRTLLKDFQRKIKNLKIKNIKKPKCYDIYNKTIKTLYPNISETEIMWFDFLFIICFVSNPTIQLGFDFNKEKIFGRRYGDVYEYMRHTITNIMNYEWKPRTSFFSKYRRNGKFSFLWYEFTSPNSKNDFKLDINPVRCDRLLKAKSVNDWLFKPIFDGKLSIKDFSYISDIPYISDIIKNSWKGEKGINILLYGVPGTGKTELCKALAKDLGATLYSTGSRTKISDDKCATGYDKVNDIKLINESIPVDKKPLILVDEAEDIFYTDTRGGISKANLNETLENTKYPVLWTTNDAYIDPAFRRRFTYAICFDNIPRAKRKEIIEEICKKEDFIITDRVINNILDNNVDFGTASTVIHTAKLNKGSEDEILKHLEQQVRLYSTTYHEAKNFNANVFDPKLTNTDIDLINLCEKIKQTGRYNFTICSYGAPGTGKSAYAEYLAEQLNMPIIKKKASDLLSMWVGGTEQNVAKAFKEAKDSKAVLVFDEADSLLQDRRNAHASWEVTQVNEMLVQMENHPYPFICTTNLYDKLDQASLRRFTFKIGYKYMTDNQIKLAFKHFFGIDTETKNFHLSTCTAGDFMNIKNQVEFLGTKDFNSILNMLTKEQENKNDDKPKRTIGFCP